MTVQFDLNMEVIKLIALYTVVVALIGGFSFLFYKYLSKCFILKMKSLFGFVKNYVDKRRASIWWLKTRHFLLRYDTIWSVPLGFLIFIGSVHLIQHYYPQAGFNDFGFITSLFLAFTVGLGTFGGATIINKLFFKKTDKYLYGEKIDGKWINQSKKDFQEAQPYERLKLSLFLFLYVVTLLVVIFGLLVK